MEKDHLEIFLEDVTGKFDLVLEGHDLLRKEIRDTREELCEKIQFLDLKVDATLDKLDRKIDSVRDGLGKKNRCHRRYAQGPPGSHRGASKSDPG